MSNPTQSETKICVTCGQNTAHTFNHGGECYECAVYSDWLQNPEVCARTFNIHGVSALWRRAIRLHTSIGKDEDGNRWYWDANGNPMRRAVL